MECFDIIIACLGCRPYIAVFVSFCLLLIFFPIPEEAILFTGGYLASEYSGGDIWLPTLAAGIAGVLMTDYWVFFLSQRYGRRMLNNRYILRIISKKKQERAIKFVERFGPVSVFLVRFIPGGLRNPVFFICGISNISRVSFAAASLSGALLSSQISFWLGYYLARSLPPIQTILSSVNEKIHILLIAALTAGVIIYFIKKLFRRR